jgi:branched-chain amino acid transport system ATP-binding protein
MLQIKNLDAGYGDIQVLRNITMDVNESEIVTVIGANGAGKTTLVKTISGLLPTKKGSITFFGKKINNIKANKIVAEGIVQVPEGRQLFPDMSVQENLEMGGFLVRDRKKFNDNLDAVYASFPILRERHNQSAKTLSGGEQQMLAIGRALMAAPKLIIFDEPSLGLAPLFVEKVYETIIHINSMLNITVLLIEQNVQKSCEISNRGFVLENGEVVLNGAGTDLLKNPHIQKAYLGL